MLWLVLYLPRLPLEVFPRLSSPGAIISRERVVVADEAATSAGVVPGLRLAEAWAFVPHLAVQERDPVREQLALDRLACWAGSFTSDVCCRPPATLLLEVAGSLNLFGGAEALFRRVVFGCSGQGFTPQAALAPTPLAAQWLALAGDDRPCLDKGELAGRLGCLPLTVLGLSVEDHLRLGRFGVRSLAGLFALPRAGLARRLGSALAADLGRALGDLPDPRPRFAFPERFVERLELPARVDSAPALGFTGRRLVASLCGWLAARGGAIRECSFVLDHPRGAGQWPVTTLKLGFSGATRDAERIGRVFIERLQRLELAAPVEQIGLQAGEIEALSGHTAGLFGDRGEGAGGESLAVLVERLQARLGQDRVHALSVATEHRPENASRQVAPQIVAGGASGLRASGMRQTPCGPRPLWLLARPQPLSEAAGRPVCGGPLQLLAGPERIESGWWDAAEPAAIGDVRRDYFVAVSARSEWLWIFRSRAGWFLHGVFA